jgi:hypothetical protein
MVCKSVLHRTIQINHQPDATIFQFIILTFVYSSTCFGRFPAHHQELNDCSGSVWFNYFHKRYCIVNLLLNQVAAIVLCSFRLMFLYEYISNLQYNISYENRYNRRLPLQPLSS